MHVSILKGDKPFSDPSGTRTQNTLIKSQLLCQIELMGLIRKRIDILH